MGALSCLLHVPRPFIRIIVKKREKEKEKEKKGWFGLDCFVHLTSLEKKKKQFSKQVDVLFSMILFLLETALLRLVSPCLSICQSTHLSIGDGGKGGGPLFSLLRNLHDMM